MKRITPAEVQQAYEATGLTPIEREFCLVSDGEPCGACAVVALWLATVPRDEWPDDDDTIAGRASRWAAKIYSDFYLDGFLIGVDGRGAPHWISNPHWHEGFADGQAVRAATVFAPEVSRG